MRLVMCVVMMAGVFALPVQAKDAVPPTREQVAQYADNLLADNYAADGPGAAVLVARGDQVLYRGARGMASIELGVPLSVDQEFRLGSITKQFAAAGLLKLVEAGKLSLDDPLSKFLPTYPNGNKITVRELLNHTSGVKNYTEISGRMGLPVRADLSTAQMVDTFKDQPADFAPGEGWNYSNSGYVLVGAVIEKVTGEPWHVYLQKALFTPLGMSHTRFGDDHAIIPGMVHGYSMDSDKVVPSAYISMTQPHAAGSLVSTLDDLLRWNRALHGGKVLSDAMYRQMTTPTGKAQDGHYGFGLELQTLRGHPTIQHGGDIFGFSAALTWVPDAGLSVIVLHNSDSDPPGTSGPERIAATLGAVALGDPYPEVKPIPIDIDTLKSFQGVYRIDAKTTRVLRMHDGALTAQRTGGERTPLVPIAVDEFAYPGTFSLMRIERDAKGAITGMRVFQGGEGLGDVAPLTTDPLPTERKAVALPRAALQRVVGNYIGDGMAMRVFVDGDTLKTQMMGQSALTLFAQSQDQFFVTEVDATLEFAPASGAVTTMTLTQEGHRVVFKRGADQ